MNPELRVTVAVRRPTYRVRLVGALALTVLFSVAALPAAVSAAVFSARASLSPTQQFLGDSSGTLFTLTVENTGTTYGLGAVSLKRPNNTWTVIGCSGAPAGWTVSVKASRCRYTSAAGTGDDIPTGQSRTFQALVRSAPGTDDRSATWIVAVSRTNSFADSTKVKQAAANGSGLKVTVYSFQILSAMVSVSTATPGAPCPAANTSATAGTTGQTVVICGRNRSTATRTPAASNAQLGGTFIAGSGSFSSGLVAPSTTSRVLGNWTNVTIGSPSATGRTVAAKIGSSSVRTSPTTTLTGYVSLNSSPVLATSAGTTACNEDSPAVAVDPSLTIADADDANLVSATVSIAGGLQTGDALSVTGSAGPWITVGGSSSALTLTGPAPVADFQAALRLVGFGTTHDSTSPRTIMFEVNDGESPSNAPTKGVTVAAANDAPILANIEVTDLAYTVSSPATIATTTTTVGDTDSLDFNLGALTVDIAAGGAAGDVLGIFPTGSITISGPSVKDGFTTIGSWVFADGMLTVTFNGSATLARVQAVVRAVSYHNTESSPSTTTRTVRFVVTDGDGGTSAPATRNITIATP